MNPITDERGIRLAELSDFDLAKTLECGQCFRWSADDTGVYTGIAYGHAVQIWQDSSDVVISCSVAEYETIWRRYFDIERDYAQIRKQLSISGFMENVLTFGSGIRILKQEPWETLCSFIFSQNNNIPRIKKLIDALCRCFGEPLEIGGKTLFAFPSAEKLAMLSEDELSPLRSGYRARYILSAARAVTDGTLNLASLYAFEPEKAKLELKKLCGVGDKVADCVMLYGLHMLDSFPADVWIKRAIGQYFRPDFNPSIFKPYAGIAQQYIFYHIRNYEISKKA